MPNETSELIAAYNQTGLAILISIFLPLIGMLIACIIQYARYRIEYAKPNRRDPNRYIREAAARFTCQRANHTINGTYRHNADCRCIYCR